MAGWRRCGLVALLCALAVCGRSALAQPGEAPIPRVSPKFETAPIPRLSPRSDAAPVAADQAAEPTEAETQEETPPGPEAAAAEASPSSDRTGEGSQRAAARQAEQPLEPEALEAVAVQAEAPHIDVPENGASEIAAPEIAAPDIAVSDAPAPETSETAETEAAESPEADSETAARPTEPAQLDPAEPAPAPAEAPDAVAAEAPISPDRDWYAEAEAAINARLAARPIEGRARNVILMIGDGLGVATATAIRVHMNQATGGLGEERLTPQEAFPNSALIQTYTVNAQTGDGAATATALMSGVKTRSGVLGLDQTAVRGRCGSGAPLTRLGDLFAADGRSVGYVTTARITHATPAAGFGRSVERLWEHDGLMPADCLQRDLAQQLVDRMAAGEVTLALGGGRAAFFPEDQTDQEQAAGARQDGRNLLEEAREQGVRTVWDAASLAAVDLSAPGPLLGLFARRSMAYAHDRETLRRGEPSLAAMTETAIKALEASSDGRGFFLMVEGGRIGQASHYGNLHRTVTDGAAFAEAVARAAALTDERDTLILVTGDASHSLAFNGYCGRGSPVPGLCYEINATGVRHGPEAAVDATGAPYETTGFLNGPGAEPDLATAKPAARQAARETAREKGAALTAEAARDPNRRQRALVPMEVETTSAADAPAYARGPWAHLVNGVMDQHQLFHVMRRAAFGAPKP